MTFTFSSKEEIDYAKLGMCPVCGVRFTAGCEHSDTIEAQQWLAAYIVAEQLDDEDFSDMLLSLRQKENHPVDEAQKIEREIDTALDGEKPEWMVEAEAEHADWKDNNRTMEEARF